MGQHFLHMWWSIHWVLIKAELLSTTAQLYSLLPRSRVCLTSYWHQASFIELVWRYVDQMNSVYVVLMVSCKWFGHENIFLDRCVYQTVVLHQHWYLKASSGHVAMTWLAIHLAPQGVESIVRQMLHINNTNVRLTEKFNLQSQNNKKASEYCQKPWRTTFIYQYQNKAVTMDQINQAVYSSQFEQV